MAVSPYEGLAARNAERLAQLKFVRDNPFTRTDGKLNLNAGISKEAYFQSRQSPQFKRDPKTGRVTRGTMSIWDILKTDYITNTPQEQFRVENLWTGSQNSKGMFAASKLLSPTYVDPRGSAFDNRNNKRVAQYGFQFHYNPQTIQMAYAGNADFDVTMFTSGREGFNLLGGAATQSNISFNLVLNRMFDMKYFNTNGTLKANVNRFDWSGKFPATVQEQKDIYNKGTMYDIEYFLRTITGITPPPPGLGRRASFDGNTADMGFLTGIPVDLHLGNALRYWVRVDSFVINHTIFNERMVPIFSEVAITCSRIPDYRNDYKATTTTNKPTPEPTKAPTESELYPENFSGVRVSGFPSDYPENETLDEEYDRLWADWNNR